jgi:hypothetical protein
MSLRLTWEEIRTLFESADQLKYISVGGEQRRRALDSLIEMARVFDYSLQTYHYAVVYIDALIHAKTAGGGTVDAHFLKVF